MKTNRGFELKWTVIFNILLGIGKLDRSVAGRWEVRPRHSGYRKNHSKLLNPYNLINYNMNENRLRTKSGKICAVINKIGCK